MTTTGITFNIQRFSIHDGPGIRTTIFFKGCSLCCFWCHNPEGIQPKPEIQVFPNLCIGCGECFNVCPRNAHEQANGARVFHRDLCAACGQCADICYAGALELTGKQITTAQVMEEVLRDRAFYKTSGGGVTLSGGEPLMQRDFALDILERCKAEGIHTAVETAGDCRWRDLAALLPVIDLVMMDIKHMDSAKHRSATGVSNDRILANARRLMETDKPVIFRVPVVPTVNDTPEEIRAIALFVHELSELRRKKSQSKGSFGSASNETRLPSLELLPFHRLAADKYRSLGLDYRAGELEPLTREKMARLAEIARQCGGPSVKCKRFAVTDGGASRAT